MVLKDISFPSPQENILFDDVLLSLAENGKSGEALRLWESKTFFIVLGKTSKEKEDVHLSAASKDGLVILRRSSGGGTVLQGPGCLNYSLILSKEKRPEVALLRKSYEYILGKIVEGFLKKGLRTAWKPVSDVVVEGSEKKFSGNAQKRGRKFILHHGTFLYDFDASLIERYLRMPKIVPEYRRRRGHKDFVTNLPLSSAELKALLGRAFGAGNEEPVTFAEKECLDSFLQSKNIMVDCH